MKLKEKLLSAITLTATTAAVIAVINKIIFSRTDAHVFSTNTDASFPLTYHWRFGQIRYKKCGTGRPILLIHSIDPAANSYEWNRVISPLSKTHTVYSLDLIGCGFSEKPSLLYTNFLYVQLLTDFVKDIIGRRTDVLCSGNASSVVIMACRNDDTLFDRIAMINPESIGESVQIPTSKSKLIRFFYELPIIGTLGYNIAFSKRMIHERYYKEFVSSPCPDSKEEILTFYNNAHLGGYNCKMLYASLRGKYMNLNVSKAIREINNSILLIGGSELPNMEETLREYQLLNPAIETSVFPRAKQLIALEYPDQLLEVLSQF